MKVIHASESRSAAEVTAQRVPATLDDMKLSELGEWIAAAVDEIVTYLQFPAKHWRKIRTNNPLE
jgi:transposase-like protein